MHDRLDETAMLFPELAERLRLARTALDLATSDTLIELCQKYLALLDEYRAELYRLSPLPRLNQSTNLSLSNEEIEGARKETRVAIEQTTRERNRIKALLLSFTAVSGYQAVETLNRLRYEGHESWTLRAGGVRFNGGSDVDRISIREAVAVASLLRRQEYIVQNAAVARV